MPCFKSGPTGPAQTEALGNAGNGVGLRAADAASPPAKRRITKALGTFAQRVRQMPRRSRALRSPAEVARAILSLHRLDSGIPELAIAEETLV